MSLLRYCGFDLLLGTIFSSSSLKYLLLHISVTWLSFLLTGVLEAAGHKVTLKESKDRNILEIFVNGQMVFRCDQQNLDFGKPSINWR